MSKAHCTAGRTEEHVAIVLHGRPILGAHATSRTCEDTVQVRMSPVTLWHAVVSVVDWGLLHGRVAHCLLALKCLVLRGDGTRARVQVCVCKYVCAITCV